MKRLKVYQYDKCDTCRKALKWLAARGIEVEKIDITQTPPTKAELARIEDVKRLFNTSGVQYRELGIAKKLPGMTKEEAIDLLSKNGRLVKRPFVPEHRLVGFREEEWKQAL